jgi:hypothetical protein
LFDIPFRPELFEWGDLTAGLESGGIDFTGELTATEERLNPGDPEQKPYFMTDAIAERSIVIIRLAGSPPLFDIAAARPPRYAFLEGASTIDDAASAAHGPYEAVYVEDYKTAYGLLKSGAADGFVSESTDEAAFDPYGDVIAENFFPLVYSPVSLSTKNPRLKPIISVMQKALENGADRYLAQLYGTGEHRYIQHKLFSLFSEQELAYIRDSRAVGFVAEHDNYPISFYNSR